MSALGYVKPRMGGMTVAEAIAYQMGAAASCRSGWMVQARIGRIVRESEDVIRMKVANARRNHHEYLRHKRALKREKAHA